MCACDRAVLVLSFRLLCSCPTRILKVYAIFMFHVHVLSFQSTPNCPNDNSYWWLGNFGCLKYYSFHSRGISTDRSSINYGPIYYWLHLITPWNVLFLVHYEYLAIRRKWSVRRTYAWEWSSKFLFPPQDASKWSIHWRDTTTKIFAFLCTVRSDTINNSICIATCDLLKFIRFNWSTTKKKMLFFFAPMRQRKYRGNDRNCFVRHWIQLTRLIANVHVPLTKQFCILELWRLLWKARYYD